MWANGNSRHDSTGMGTEREFENQNNYFIYVSFKIRDEMGQNRNIMKIFNQKNDLIKNEN